MKKFTLLLLVSMFFTFTGLSYGESYISLYAGGAFPENVDWNDNVGIASGGTINLDNSVTFGIKGGHWLTEANAPFLGFEFETNVQLPDWNSITTSRALGFTIIPPVTTSVTANTVLVSGLFNGLVRYPKGPVRPYAGGGIGFAVWAIGNQTLGGPGPGTGTFNSEADASFAWDIIAGIDFRLSDMISLFGEYKYLGANFSFPDFIGMDIDYRASLAYGGITLHY